MKRKLEPEKSSLSYSLVKSRSSFWNRKIWSHIELGAGNYGGNVNADETHITDKGLGIEQHKLLFMTADKLIQSKGKNGIIYINDLDEKIVDFTIEKLKNYLLENHPKSKIELRPLVGDFFEIDLPEVTSIHLKNPECWFFDEFFETKIDHLEYFASQSKEGLILTTFYKSYLLKLLPNLKVNYKLLNSDFFPYIHADGVVILTIGNVVELSIKSSNQLSGRLRSHPSKGLEEVCHNQFGAPICKTV